MYIFIKIFDLKYLTFEQTFVIRVKKKTKSDKAEDLYTRCPKDIYSFKLKIAIIVLSYLKFPKCIRSFVYHLTAINEFHWMKQN